VGRHQHRADAQEPDQRHDFDAREAPHPIEPIRPLHGEPRRQRQPGRDSNKSELDDQDLSVARSQQADTKRIVADASTRQAG
jgi:hypothetical protein